MIRPLFRDRFNQPTLLQQEVSHMASFVAGLRGRSQVERNLRSIRAGEEVRRSDGVGEVRGEWGGASDARGRVDFKGDAGVVDGECGGEWSGWRWRWRRMGECVVRVGRGMRGGEGHEAGSVAKRRSTGFRSDRCWRSRGNCVGWRECEGKWMWHIGGCEHRCSWACHCPSLPNSLIWCP